jgi:hypothetical protein
MRSNCYASKSESEIGVNPAAFARYSQRDQTRREQLAELMERLGYRSFDRPSFRHYMAWLTPIAQNIRRPNLLVEMLLEELRRHRILIPTQRTWSCSCTRREAGLNACFTAH